VACAENPAWKCRDAPASPKLDFQLLRVLSPTEPTLTCSSPFTLTLLFEFCSLHNFLSSILPFLVDCCTLPTCISASFRGLRLKPFGFLSSASALHLYCVYPSRPILTHYQYLIWVRWLSQERRESYWLAHREWGRARKLHA
jgi:hypothetical protein